MNTAKISSIAATVALAGTLNAQTIDIENSVLKWTGKKIGGQHYGYIKLKSADLKADETKIINGTFVIDMNTITVTDIENPEYNANLVKHLKSDDFFGSQNFNTAKLVINKSALLTNGKASVTASLTIKDITQPITFDAIKTADGYKALITVNRAKFNVKYASSSFFGNLGDKAIYDDFTLEVNLVYKHNNQALSN